jgi:hypothetical protein
MAFMLEKSSSKFQVKLIFLTNQDFFQSFSKYHSQFKANFQVEVSTV